MRADAIELTLSTTAVTLRWHMGDRTDMVGFCGAESDFGCRKKTHGCRGREHENRLTSLDKGRLADPVVIFVVVPVCWVDTLRK